MMPKSCRYAALLPGAALVFASAVARGGPSPAVSSGTRAVPTPGTSSVLEAVTCTSATNCWAVGYDGNSSGANVNQALRWNGTTWSLVTTPDPGGTASGDNNQLFGVGCASSSNCWAVGDYFHGAELNEALHWNGTKWSLVSTPTPGGTLASDLNYLLGVRCVSASNCWAVGGYGSFTGAATTVLNQALRWNGTTWSQVTTPNPGGTATGVINSLNTIRCTSASNCWTAGSYGSSVMLNEALRWNGTTWSQVTTPNPGGTSAPDFSNLVGLSCTSASHCWAVGAYGSNGAPVTSLNQVLRWNGTTWTQATTPNPDGTGAGASNELAAAACTAVGNCWAVGDYGSIRGGVGTFLNEALQWNGTTWSQAAMPNPGGTANNDVNRLFGVGCASASNCWAVGEQGTLGSTVNEALHWNGTQWSTA